MELHDFTLSRFQLLFGLFIIPHVSSIMGANATSLSKEQAMQYKEFEEAKWDGLQKDESGNVAVGALLPFAPQVTAFTCDTSICSMICRVAVEEHKVPNMTPVENPP